MHELDFVHISTRTGAGMSLYVMLVVWYDTY